MKLKFSGNIIPINEIFVLLGGEPVPGTPSFFYMETLVKEYMGGIHQTLLCQGPNGTHKWNKNE